MSPLRGVRAAFVFLTRVPVGGRYVASDWTWATAHFPFVGAVLGAVTGLVYVALLPVGALGAAFLAMAVSMMLTGAFHEDGLADTSDALGGAFTREKVLVILKDSRVGSFGAAALVVSIGARAALLSQSREWWWLAVVGCVARVGPVWLIRLLPYVSDPEWAKSRSLTHARWPQAIVGTLWMVLVLGGACALGWVSVPRALVMSGVLVLVTLVCGWRYLVRLGGLTGDFLGATEQICEMAALAVLAWR
jgi:adenosylcobinamide-GDP ribazoletransferase